MWLASRCPKIANAARLVPNPEAERNPATAHMFIINPLSGHGMDNLFDAPARPKTASPRCSSLRRKWARRAGRLSVNARGNYPRRSPWGRPLGLTRPVGVKQSRVGAPRRPPSITSKLAREGAGRPTMERSAM